jgi:SAM-dependent methyltransferase
MTTTIFRSPLSMPHNWLIHHYTFQSVLRHQGIFRGKVLDVGCGRKPYRDIIEPKCDQYIGMDIEKKDTVDVVGDAQKLPFDDQSFDVVVAFQLMEHLPEPNQFLSECYRVARPGGHILITTPFMWGEHEQPRDFYRYTRFGLRYLAEKAGFEVCEITPDTGYWPTAVLRFNYWLVRFAKGPLKYLFWPVWLNQYVALLLDSIERRVSVNTSDTSTFTTLLKKPELK